MKIEIDYFRLNVLTTFLIHLHIIVSDENYDVNNFYIELSRLLLNKNSRIISFGSQPVILFKTCIQEYCYLKFKKD